MNRTFLIFLMIGTAMMIAVIGQHKPVKNLDYMPWQVDRLENGSIRVFGITLGKTTIQDANQIYASFAETELLVGDLENLQTHQLIAYYDELSIGGLLAKIQLSYQLDTDTLKSLKNKLELIPELADQADQQQRFKIDKKSEMSFLSTPIASITYIPSIDYSQEIIRQRFGQADEELKISEQKQIWIYPELGLEIHIYENDKDQFIYSPLR